MKKVIFVGVLILICVFIVRGVIISIEKSKEKVYSIPDIQKEQGIPVEIKRVEVSSIINSKLFTGTIKGIEQADATSKIQEKIEKILIRVGDKVDKGKVIAILSKDNPSARYKQVELA